MWPELCVITSESDNWHREDRRVIRSYYGGKYDLIPVIWSAVSAPSSPAAPGTLPLHHWMQTSPNCGPDSRQFLFWRGPQVGVKWKKIGSKILQQYFSWSLIARNSSKIIPIFPIFGHWLVKWEELVECSTFKKKEEILLRREFGGGLVTCDKASPWYLDIYIS